MSDWIAFMAGEGPGNSDISIIASDGDSLRQLTSARSTNAIALFPFWFSDGTKILYQWRSVGMEESQETRSVRLDGSNGPQYPGLIGLDDAVSPDDTHLVTGGLQADDTMVLFVRELDDPEGRTLRQLTSYMPEAR
jgi:Tol biopolymer transport system component